MITPALTDAIQYQKNTVGKALLRELVGVQVDYENTASYVLRDQLRALVTATIKTIQEKPALVNALHLRTERYCTEYFQYAKRVLRIDVAHRSTAQLIAIYAKLNHLQKISHGYAVATTWFVDSDEEDLTKFLMERVRAGIQAAKSQHSVAEVFSLLTTPTKPSLEMKEEIASLKISLRIARDKNAKQIFAQTNTAKIEHDLLHLNPKLRREIMHHYEKWRWTPYTYIGPAYELRFYLETWSNLLRENFNVAGHLKNLLHQPALVAKQKRKLLRELRIGARDRRLFAIAADIIYLKAFRKDSLFFGCYALEHLHREIARRLNLSLKQVRFMADWEVAPALRRGSFSEHVLNERIKFSVYYQHGLKGVIYTGKKAKQFLSHVRIEKEKIERTDQLAGTCACPGMVKGVVKIINSPDQMGKMNQGDVMVAHTTFPALVPAMKKAAAIITDDGGITCHAAIVARELKTPCVVGTKVATKILKDGDRVEVDADKGIVKILQR